MKSRLISLIPALALTVVLAGCTADVPSPVDPGGEPQFQGVASQAQAARWFAQASPAVLELAGTVFADHDEATNRLVFGVEHEAAIRGVRTALSRLGIPASAFEVRLTEPIHMVATLRDRWRPTQAGVQIHFGGFLCSLGFNADDGTERSMITASHCTNTQGGVEGTQYFQPTSTVDPTVIATEVEDPTYFTSKQNSACPRGRKCRYSDAARASYSAAVASTRGAIARTSGPNNGSLEVVGSFTVTSQNNTGTTFTGTINKVGRTTGWTQGDVTNTCVHANVFASNITQLCQTFVRNPGAVLVQGGDSGANVFRITGGDRVQLVGILWGGSGDGRLFVFSPLKNVRDELGPINAVQ